jgi:hypothetical protein
MAGRTCHNCIYSFCDQELWLRWIAAGESVVPQCANHPRWPGQLHDVPGVPCRNCQPKPAVPTGDNVRWIPLGDGSYAYVDASDYEWLSQWDWHTGKDGYPARYEKGKWILMHRQIMQPPTGMILDHIDGNRANNCRFNLRVCTRQENVLNKRKRSGSSRSSRASATTSDAASGMSRYLSRANESGSGGSRRRWRRRGPMTARRSSCSGSMLG